MEVALPLDEDGFLRRECPTCVREFKWFHGATAERPDDVPEPESYFCPLCGVPALPDQWFTQRQLEFLQASLFSDAEKEVDHMLKDAIEGNEFIKVKSAGRATPKPLPLAEEADMDIVEPPCHPWEPVKVPEDWEEAIHCLVCGQRFVT